MSAPDAYNYLESLGIDAMKSLRPSLHRIEAIVRALDHPERPIPAVHVTGTNGKTSIARIASSLLSAAGLTVGTYTSPHLTSVNERIALNGKPLDKGAFQAAFVRLWPYLRMVEEELGERLSYFELLTAMYFLWAAEQPVDVSVVEVGMGGTWDATNVVNAPVGVISNVALDHTRFLGNEPETIAREKAGIAKPGSVVVTAERTPSVLEVISEVAGAQGASLSVIDRDFEVTENRPAVGGRYVSLRTSARSYADVLVSLYGSHQAMNAAVGLEAVTRLLPKRPFEPAIVEEALGSISVPGRLEALQPVDGNGPALVLDVAHNPDGASVLVKGLSETFTFERVVFEVGVLDDKDHRGIVAELSRVPCHLVATRPTGSRGLPAERLAEAARSLEIASDVVADPLTGVTRALAKASNEDIVCVTGSHYLVGEVRAGVEQATSGRYAPSSSGDKPAATRESS